MLLLCLLASIKESCRIEREVVELERPWRSKTTATRRLFQDSHPATAYGPWGVGSSPSGIPSLSSSGSMSFGMQSSSVFVSPADVLL